MKNILFFAHYNKYDLLQDYVLYLLDHIKHIYDRIVFISNSKIPDDKYENLAGLCHSVIIRENKGFDFGAWKDALLREGWDKLTDYDTVTLMNDTCFGPLYDLYPVYEQMEARKTDFWGLTNYRTTGKTKLSRDGPPYVQSYFICFGKKIIRSFTFQRFWNKVKYLEKYKK
ncbi:MAG: hypothetical protein LBI86_12490, partial [Treponema sp.]|nr:hypothetical protein [Treponema sp.]